MAEALSRTTEASIEFSEPSAFQRRVLILALGRLGKCLEVPSSRVRELFDELGVSRRELSRAVRNRQVWAAYGDSEKEAEEELKEEEARSADDLVSLLMQDMTLAFFTAETLYGEQAPEGAIPWHDVLWRKVTELKETRDQILVRAKLTPEQRRLVTPLVEALEDQARDGVGNSPFDAKECDTLCVGQRPRPISRERSTEPPSILPSIDRSQVSAVSQASEIPLTTSSCWLRSTPIPATSLARRGGRISTTTTSLLTPTGGRQRHFSSPEEYFCLQRGNSGGGGNGDVGDLGDFRSFQKITEQPNMASREVVEKERGASVNVAGGAWFSCIEQGENDELDRLKKKVAGIREQYSEALGNSSNQVESVQRNEVKVLRCSLVALRAALSSEKRRRLEAIARFEGEVDWLRRESDRAVRRAKEAERQNDAAHARLVEKDADDFSRSYALEKRATTLEERSRATAVRNERLRDRLDAVLGDVEEMLQYNKDLTAELEASRSSQEALIAQKLTSMEENAAERERLARELTDARARISSLQNDEASLHKAHRTVIAEAESLRRSLARARREAVEARATASLVAEATIISEVSPGAATAVAGAVREAEQTISGKEAARRRGGEGADHPTETCNRWNEAAFERTAEASAAVERDDWVTRSRGFEDEAKILVDALQTPGEESAKAREGLMAVVIEIAESLAKARGELARVGQLREEEAASAREREAGLRDELKTAQTAALMSEDSPARVPVAEGTDTQDAPAVFFSRPRLFASNTQQDAARRSLLNLARLRGLSPLPRFHDDGSVWKEEEGCGGGDGSDLNSGTPARGGEGGLGDRGLESGSGLADLRIRDGEGRRGVTARGFAESRESGCYGDRNLFRAPEEGGGRCVPGSAACAVEAGDTRKSSRAVGNESGGGFGHGVGEGEGGGEYACLVCGAIVGRVRRLVEAGARLHVIEGAEAVAFAAKNTVTSNLERLTTR